MRIKIYYENKNEVTYLDVPDADCEIWVETDYQQRFEAATDKSSVTRRTAQEIMDEECNKPTFNSHHRETRRHVSLDALDPNSDTVPASGDFTEAFDEDFSYLYEAIERLRPQQRELVKKIFWEGMKQVEIARAEGVDEAAVSGRMKRIYARLRKILKEKK